MRLETKEQRETRKDTTDQSTMEKETTETGEVVVKKRLPNSTPPNPVHSTQSPA